jgi:hypothetical protein
MAYREVPVGTEPCLGCGGEVEQGTALCPTCGSPIDVAQFAELELRLKPHLRQARQALAVATALFGCCLLLLASMAAPASILLSSMLGVVVFGGCYLLSLRRPLAASVTALSIFTGLQVATIAEGKVWLFVLQGWLVMVLKVVLVVLLAAGVRAGLRARDIRRQSRPADRKLAAAIVALTVLAGIALGVWSRARDDAREALLLQQIQEDAAEE